MGKSSAPPPPDYAAAAVAQGQENRDTARFNAGANRVNQVTPQGSSSWTIRPGADLNNPQPGDYIQTTTLSPEQQRIYGQTAAIDNALLDTAGSQLSRVRQTFDSPIDLSGLPGWRTSGQMGGQPAANATAPRMGQGGAPTGGGGAGLQITPDMLQAVKAFISGQGGGGGGAGMGGGAAGMAAGAPSMSAGMTSPSMSYSSGPQPGMPASFGGGIPSDSPFSGLAGGDSGGAAKVLSAMMARK